jgi:hypothetical protein
METFIGTILALACVFFKIKTALRNLMLKPSFLMLRFTVISL